MTVVMLVGGNDTDTSGYGLLGKEFHSKFLKWLFFYWEKSLCITYRILMQV